MPECAYAIIVREMNYLLQHLLLEYDNSADKNGGRKQSSFLLGLMELVCLNNKYTTCLL